KTEPAARLRVADHAHPRRAVVHPYDQREGDGRDDREQGRGDGNLDQREPGCRRSAFHWAMSSRIKTYEFCQGTPPWTTRTHTRSMKVVTPAFVTSSGSMCTSRHITVESLRTVALPHPAVSVPPNQAAANEERLESVFVLSTPFPASSASKGPAIRSSPIAPPPAGGLPSMTSSIHPPVPGSALGSKAPPTAIAVQLIGVVVVAVGTLLRVRLEMRSMRECANRVMSVRRREMEFALEATIIEPISPSAATARMASEAIVSMSEEPAYCRLALMAAVPEEPAQEAGGRLPDAVGGGCGQLQRA